MGKLRFKIFFVILVTLFVFNFSVSAEKRKVKVAFVPIEGMQEIDTNGNPKGYMYEYFNQLALRANWDLEFIPMTWTETLDSLQTGKIDFSGMLPYADYLKEKVYYSKNHTGSSDSSIFVRTDDNRFFYSDPISLDKKTIGLIKGGLIEQDLDEYCVKNNISINKKYYPSNKDVIIALKNKEIDAGANVTYQNEPNTKIVHHFESSPLYICTSIKNKDLIQELENAFSNLLLFHPDYNSLLHSYYFLGETQKQIVLTRREQDFINNNPVVNAVYKSDWIPIEYTNKKGEFAGAVRKVFDKITKLTGLKFNFIPVLTKEEAVQALQEGKALIDTAFDNSIQAAELYGIHVTKAYYSIPMEIITNPRVKEDISTFTYGSIDPENLEQVKSLTNILLKETNKECLDAVKKGDAKNIYLNSTVRKYLFQTDNYNKLQVAFQGDRKTTLYVGLANTAPIELYTIIEKSLLSILPSEISGYFDEASRISPPLTFSLFIKKHTLEFVLVILLFVIIAMGIIIYTFL
jgi:ABC-type amino acid transport substrate-binding protein